MDLSAVHYLKAAGFDYKPAESPELREHLEHAFHESNRVGSRFDPVPGYIVAELIAKGEDALLEDMVTTHRRTGKLKQVTHIIDLPYVVGVEGVIRLKDANRKALLQLIDQPGKAHERIINVLPVMASARPITHQVIAIGGVYADGHTAGYYGLYPGHLTEQGADIAYLVTKDEIRTMLHEMEMRAEDITVATQGDCADMVAKAKTALGNRRSTKSKA